MTRAVVPAFVRSIAALGFGLACLGQAQAGIVDLGVLANNSDYGADCTFWCVDRYQQIYRADQFASGGINISRVSFFAAPDNGNAWNGTSTWRMTLSTTSKAVGGLSSSFNFNLGADAAVFATATFSGAMSFGDLVSFTGSFDYDASLGNLIIDIQRISGSAQGVGLQSVFNPAGAVFDRAYAFDSYTTAEGLNQNYANRTQFEFGNVTSNNVPEPTSLALAAAALLMMGGTARRAARRG